MRFLLASVALLAATESAASGFNLAWQACLPDGGTISRMNATCVADTGIVGTIIGSLVLSTAVPDKVADEAVLDVQTSAPTIEPWWQFYNPGACRRPALRASLDFSEITQQNCIDPWQQQASSAIAVYIPGFGQVPNRARLVLGGSVIHPFAVEADREYLSFAVQINRQNTTVCPGCTGSAVIVLNEIRSTRFDGSSERVTTPLLNQLVQYGGEVTPARNVTWGQVKSLYR